MKFKIDYQQTFEGNIYQYPIEVKSLIKEKLFHLSQEIEIQQ